MGMTVLGLSLYEMAQEEDPRSKVIYDSDVQGFEIEEMWKVIELKAKKRGRVGIVVWKWDLNGARVRDLMRFPISMDSPVVIWIDLKRKKMLDSGEEWIEAERIVHDGTFQVHECDVGRRIETAESFETKWKRECSIEILKETRSIQVLCRSKGFSFSVRIASPGLGTEFGEVEIWMTDKLEDESRRLYGHRVCLVGE